VNVGDEPNLLN